MLESGSIVGGAGAAPVEAAAGAPEGPAAAPSPSPAGTIWMRCLVVLAVVAAFAPLWNCQFVNWDDSENFVDNPRYRGLSLAHLRWMFTTFHGGHYQPLSWVTVGLDYTLWGMQPRGYHLTNLLLHVVNALLVYALTVVLLRRAASRRAPDGPALRLAAAVAALGFAIHPLRVESVAWVTERRDVLSGCFWLLTVLAYVRMADARRAGQGAGGDWRTWYAVSLGCFLLSLLSKAWGMTLPVVLVMLDVYPLRRLTTWRALPRRLWIEKIPFLALAGGAMALAAFTVRAGGQVRTLAEHGVAARALQGAYGLMFYLWKTVAPINLSPLYPLRPDFNPFAPLSLLCALGVVAITAVLVGMRRRFPWVLVAWASYVVIVSPVLGFLQSGPQLVADRYTYLACVPWALLAGAAVYGLPASRRRVGAIVATGILLALGVLTFRQTRVWTDGAALWDQALSVDPSNYVAHLNRGWLQMQHGDADGAMAHYEEALRLNPRLPDAYRNRGFLRHVRNDLQGAIDDYNTALDLDPTHAITYFNRGLARHALGDADGAIADYSVAVQAPLPNPQAYSNRARLRRQRGDLTGAIDDFEKSLQVASPTWPGRAQAEEDLQATRDQAAAAPPSH